MPRSASFWDCKKIKPPWSCAPGWLYSFVIPENDTAMAKGLLFPPGSQCIQYGFAFGVSVADLPVKGMVEVCGGFFP